MHQTTSRTLPLTSSELTPSSTLPRTTPNDSLRRREMRNTRCCGYRTQGHTPFGAAHNTTRFTFQCITFSAPAGPRTHAE